MRRLRLWITRVHTAPVALLGAFVRFDYAFSSRWVPGAFQPLGEARDINRESATRTRPIETNANVVPEIEVLERVEPTASTYRFQVLFAEPTVFKDNCLVRQRARVSRAGRRCIDFFGSAPAADLDLQARIHRKFGRGNSLRATTRDNPTSARRRITSMPIDFQDRRGPG